MSGISATYSFSLPPIFSVDERLVLRSCPDNRDNPVIFSHAIRHGVRYLNYKLNVRQLRTSFQPSHIETHENIFRQVPTVRELCEGIVPEDVLQRAEEAGFVRPTDIQLQALPVLFSGRDCILHSQTGSGKTLAYLLLIFAVINIQRSAVQALIVVPTRELGMQVAKVSRMLAPKSFVDGVEQKSCTVMTILDGGLLKRHRGWLKAEPPTIVVATIGSLCRMLEKRALKLQSLQVLVIDEVDYMFHSSEQVTSLGRLLASYSTISTRQTIFASASIPQHHNFVHDCIQDKWTKADVTHIHVNPVEPMPSRLCHRFVICGKKERHNVLLSLLQSDTPNSGIIFVNQQSAKSRKAGNVASGGLLIDFLKTSYKDGLEVHLLEDKMNFNMRAASLSEVREGSGHLLVATDLAARGVDLPETTHIYNYDFPETALEYLHRAGRTGRKPFSDEKCTVTSLVSAGEQIALQKYENELMFQCVEFSI